jgi:predicted Fe-Mo cluster-binding NifX family protein
MKKATVLIICAILMFTALGGWAAATPGGAIVVSAEANSQTAMVSAIAARAPFFLIFDENGKFLEAIANPHKDAGGNTAALVTDLLVQKKAGAILAGHFGGKITKALKEKGVAYLEVKGAKAEDAVKKYLQK